MNIFKRVVEYFAGNNRTLHEMLFGSSVSLVIKLTGLLIAYLFAFSVARLLGAAAWGEFSLALSLVIFGSIIAATGFDTLLLKFSSSVDRKPMLFQIYHRSILFSFLFSVVTALLIFWFASRISESVFGNRELTFSFKIAAFAIPPYTLLNINAGILQGLQRLQKYVFIRFVSHHAGGLMLFLILVFFQDGFSVVILAYTISLYIIAMVSFAWVRKEKQLLINQIPYRDAAMPLKKLLFRSAPFMLAALLFFVKGWIDTIMIGMFMNETNVGIYNVALKLTALLGLTLSAVSAVASPKFSEAYSSGDFKDLRNNVHYASAIVFYSSLPIFLLLIIFPEQILSLFGAEFKIGKTALMVLAIGGLINSYCGMAGHFMKMTGSQLALQNITLVTVLAGIALNLWLIPVLGIEGAAIATTVAILMWNLMCVIYIKKKFSISAYYTPFKSEM